MYKYLDGNFYTENFSSKRDDLVLRQKMSLNLALTIASNLNFSEIENYILKNNCWLCLKIGIKKEYFLFHPRQNR